MRATVSQAMPRLKPNPLGHKRGMRSRRLLARSACCLLLVAVTALVLAGCGDATTKPATSSDSGSDFERVTGMSEEAYQSWLDEVDDGIRATGLPKGWVPGEPGIWYGPMKNGFARNVNVMSIKLQPEDEFSVEDMQLQMEGILPELISDITMLERGRTTFQGRDARVLEFEGRMQQLHVHQRAIYVEVDGYMYAITGTGSYVDWDEYGDEVIAAMESLDLENRTD